MSQGLHRQRAPVHLSQSAITFRTYRNRKQHLWLEVICVSLVVCLSLLAWVFVKYATTGTQQQWGRCAATVAAFPAMFAVLGFMIPQTALRITDSTVTFARTRCPRSRVRLRWDEIDRLRCGNRFIVLEGQAGQIWINSTLCTPTSWQQVREQLTNKLQDRFDLGKPSLREMRSAIDSTATSRAFTKLVIVLHTVGLPAALLGSYSLRFTILSILTTLCVIAMIWGTTSERRASWRYPREHGSTPAKAGANYARKC